MESIGGEEEVTLDVSWFQLPPGFTFFDFFLGWFFPTKNDEETKKFKLVLLGKLTK